MIAFDLDFNGEADLFTWTVQTKPPTSRLPRSPVAMLPKYTTLTAQFDSRRLFVALSRRVHTEHFMHRIGAGPDMSATNRRSDHVHVRR